MRKGEVRAYDEEEWGGGKKPQRENLITELIVPGVKRIAKTSLGNEPFLPSFWGQHIGGKRIRERTENKAWDNTKKNAGKQEKQACKAEDKKEREKARGKAVQSEGRGERQRTLQKEDEPRRATEGKEPTKTKSSSKSTTREKDKEMAAE